MELVKTLKDYEKELKTAKKQYEKLSKKLNKARSDYEYDDLYSQMEILYDDIQELTMIIQEERNKKRKEREMQELLSQS
jgi:predicted  nucleic acid-binding Zn-ribbon protein